MPKYKVEFYYDNWIVKYCKTLEEAEAFAYNCTKQNISAEVFEYIGNRTWQGVD